LLQPPDIQGYTIVPTECSTMFSNQTSVQTKVCVWPCFVMS